MKKATGGSKQDQNQRGLRFFLLPVAVARCCCTVTSNWRMASLWHTQIVSRSLTERHCLCSVYALDCRSCVILGPFVLRDALFEKVQSSFSQHRSALVFLLFFLFHFILSLSGLRISVCAGRLPNFCERRGDFLVAQACSDDCFSWAVGAYTNFSLDLSRPPEQ